jgi:hypothetical protein
MNQIINRSFYAAKPLIPRPVQIALRRQIARHKRKKYACVWPVDPRAGEKPAGWPGWPEGKQFGLVLSHDVDTRKGYDSVLRLADVEERLGFRSQFNFVPERYGKIEVSLLDELKRRGFGIGVHGLHHDGKLFSSKEIFDERAPRINAYLAKWGTRAFTTPSMIRNHRWMHALEMDYCVSTFDTDPFEPQSQGAGTIFPYWVQNSQTGRRFLELPYTLVQDFTLFILLGERTFDIWMRKLDWIAEKGGMALLNSHPDYMNFSGTCCGREEYPVEFYQNFLKHVHHHHEKRYWHALPAQVWDFLAPIAPAPALNSGP